MADFKLTKDAEGVATITWDVADKSMNVMSFEGLETLGELIDDVLGDDAVKGVVITSGKDTFAGGMDLNLLARMKEDAGDDPAKGLFEGTMKMHGLLRKIERAGMDPKTNKGGKPIAAALPGTAAGIGLELPLATHRIFLANNPKAKVGLHSEGFIKILADKKTDRVLGVHIIGADAGNLIAEAVLAMEFDASSEDIALTMHAHPTLTESMKEAALAVTGSPVHM